MENRKMKRKKKDNEIGRGGSPQKEQRKNLKIFTLYFGKIKWSKEN
jgi:hypothetical protein